MFSRRRFLKLVGVAAALLGFPRLTSAFTKPNFEIFNEEPAIRVKIRKWENYDSIAELYTGKRDNAAIIKNFNNNNPSKEILYIPVSILRTCLSQILSEGNYSVYQLGSQGENGIKTLDEIAKDFMNDSYDFDNKLAVLLVINNINPLYRELKEGDIIDVPSSFIDFDLEEKPNPEEFPPLPAINENFQNPLKVRYARSIIKLLIKKYMYGARRMYFSESKKFFKISRHKGLDLPAPVGTALYPIEDGVFIYGGYDEGKPYNGIRATYSTKSGLLVTYLHLSWINKLTPRTRINKNTIIGKVGITGNVSRDEPHVHVQMALNGKTINPAHYVLVDTKDYVMDLERHFYKV